MKLWYTHRMMWDVAIKSAGTRVQDGWVAQAGFRVCKAPTVVAMLVKFPVIPVVSVVVRFFWLTNLMTSGSSLNPKPVSPKILIKVWMHQTRKELQGFVELILRLQLVRC